MAGSRPPLPPGVIPPPKPVSQADEQYGHEILGGLSLKYELDYDHPRRSEVDDIVAKIVDSIGASNYPWHVHVFKDRTVKNAAATRGNHIFVWTGIIDSTRNEAELSAVLAHEMAHVLLQHTEPTEEESWTQVLIEVTAMAAAVGSTIATRGAYGSDIVAEVAAALTRELGQGILVNPYTRDKEHEADEVGLFLMQKAGYPPEAAIEFWSRAVNDPAFSASLPFFSTHPPASDRLQRLQMTVYSMKNSSGNNFPGGFQAKATPPSPTQQGASTQTGTKPLPPTTNSNPIPTSTPSRSVAAGRSPMQGKYPGPAVVLDPNDSFDVRVKP
ncbi:MAG TPA: M48 family metallopeptidase [Oligoflexia bacterium]|nr:M48 family metallopeptidase [Oligoflexia bacterium]HMP47369.1 M48 family metallopeptidase [Oligoflexia bacterium]